MADNVTANFSDGNIKAAIEAGEAATKLTDRIDFIDDIPVALVKVGMQIDVLTRVLEENDKRAPAPRRLKGIATLRELDSFIAHVNRFKDADSVIFADTENVKLTAVLNYSKAGPDGQRWGDHRAVYACPLSRQWKVWTGANGKMMSQEEFGDFIEANNPELANPTNPEDGKMLLRYARHKHHAEPERAEDDGIPHIRLNENEERERERICT